MSFSSRLQPHAWVLVLILTAAFVGWASFARAQRVIRVSALTEPTPAYDPTSATGYAGNIRHLVVPESDPASLQWIIQTQQMVAQNQLRLARVDYDNTPQGREVRSASLYRWWLGAVAHVHRAFTGVPIGVAVERAALWADPVLQLLLLIALTVIFARQFGSAAACLGAVGFAALYPLAGAFVPGAPDDRGLLLAGVLGSTMPLVWAMTRRKNGDARWGALVAGGFAGFTLWGDVSVGLPLVLGTALGAVLAAALERRTRSSAMEATIPWRWWAVAGAAVVLVASIVDFAPIGAGPLDFDTPTPVFGVAWLALAELLSGVTEWLRPGAQSPAGARRFRLVAAAVVIAAFAALLLWKHARLSVSYNPSVSRLTTLPGGVSVDSLVDWAHRGGGLALVATLLPLMVLIGAAVRLWVNRTGDPHRHAIAWLMGPALIAAIYACGELRWWVFVDGILLVMAVLLVNAPGSGAQRWLRVFGGAAAAVIVLSISVPLIVPRTGADPATDASPAETGALIERDLAHWLVTRTGSHVPSILAPPNLAASLCYYGGIRALSTPYPENVQGFSAAVRISGATLADEAYALVQRRELTHILVPSWDPFLDEYAKLGAAQVDQSFVNLLHQWLPPRWLRPIPYQVPAITGMEGRLVAIFEVVDVQDEITSLSHLAEYFIEMGQLDDAAKVADALAHWHPEDIGGLITQAAVNSARANAAGFKRVFDALSAQIAAEEPELPWERNVLLAIIRAEAKQRDKARELLVRCYHDATESELRSLTTGTLYRMQALARVLGVEFEEAELRHLALELLPPELRDRLQAIPPPRQ